MVPGQIKTESGRGLVKKTLVAAILALAVFAGSRQQASASCFGNGQFGFSASIGVSFNAYWGGSGSCPWACCPPYGYGYPGCLAYGYGICDGGVPVTQEAPAGQQKQQPQATAPTGPAQAGYYYPTYNYPSTGYGYSPAYQGGYGYGYGQVPSYWYGN
jgi:hypothetical protein